MKIYLRDFNGVLQSLRETDEFTIVDDPRNADTLVLWQDVRGDMLELCKINKQYLHKPVVVVQHGRGATRDYLSPNSFPMHADAFCCWGEAEQERLERAGWGDRAVVTGSPLINKLTMRARHEGKNIVFVPIITQHEEPENVMAYWKLKEVEMSKARKFLEKHKPALKTNWHAWLVDRNGVSEKTIPYHIINKNWRLIAKVTGIHDKRLYLGDVVKSLQINKTHVEDCVKLLTMTDCVVGIEEGTFQLLAMAMDIPCVMVEGFQYSLYGGIDYSSVEWIKTDAVDYANLDSLEEKIDYALSHPDHLRAKRAKVVAREFGSFACDPITNICNVIKEVKFHG